MGIIVAAVDWDAGNLAKCQKHGVSIYEIEHILLREVNIIVRDTRHSIKEGRYIATGKTETGRSVYVAFTLRMADDGMMRMRPISARYMHKREDRKYEKTAKKNS